MTGLPRYWFSLVSALPDPESGERVNVALIFGTERWASIDYINDLPKLSCLVSPSELRLFHSALDSLQKSVHSPKDLLMITAQLGPHFDISEPRELYQAPEGRTLRLLRNRYLRPYGETRTKGTRRSVQREATYRLDQALKLKLPLSATVEKIATVENLYPQIDVEAIFTAPVPRLNRAVRVDEFDILIGGVVVEHENALGAARDATARISQAFWQYTRARDALRRATGREVRTLGVVLNGTSDIHPEVRSAKEYVLHLWKGDADRLFAPERREDEQGLVDQVERLVQEQPS